MSHPYYPYPYIPYYVPPLVPYDPFTMMYLAMQWLWVPYYYALTIEMYRAVIETWRKAVEAMTKALSEASARTSQA